MYSTVVVVFEEQERYRQVERSCIRTPDCFIIGEGMHVYAKMLVQEQRSHVLYNHYSSGGLVWKVVA